MSESQTTKPKAALSRDAPADEHALAQVEKWMAMIREISGKHPDKRRVSIEARPSCN